MGAELGGTVKGDGYVNLAHYLIEQGAPVDGWGFQMHLWLGDENHAYGFSNGFSNALRDESEIISFADGFRNHAVTFPGGAPPYITELSIEQAGWRRMGYTREEVQHLAGVTVYHLARALIDAGGRSMMFYAPSVIRNKAVGERIHALATAIREMPEL